MPSAGERQQVATELQCDSSVRGDRGGDCGFHAVFLIDFHPCESKVISKVFGPNSTNCWTGPRSSPRFFKRCKVILPSECTSQSHLTIVFTSKVIRELELAFLINGISGYIFNVHDNLEPHRICRVFMCLNLPV